MLRAVGFDLDGTLFDDRQYVAAGLASAAEALAEAEPVSEVHSEEDRAPIEFGDPEEGITDPETLEADLREAYFGRGVTERTFDHVLAERDLPTALVPRLVEAYHDTDTPLYPYPDARETLATLGDEYRLGLLTGGTNGRDKLDRLGLTDYFDAVLVAPELDLTKREADPFERLLDLLDADPSEAAFVGDRPEIDFAHPNDFGMTTIRVERGPHADAEPTDRTTPDETVGRLADLPALLADLD
ncbi:HAD family hydrolase [Halorussus lipolyticus]|uniref:HAD family hydrolase n=1 Tax=Halorussus lipolyticus TaxID=3034024 RepID=UPI0023E75FD6|nr:HAD family hydrolase [Halorussus sp. DT80]